MNSPSESDRPLIDYLRVEEQLAYEYARCSTLHSIRARQIREIIYLNEE